MDQQKPGRALVSRKIHFEINFIKKKKRDPVRRNAPSPKVHFVEKMVCRFCEKHDSNYLHFVGCELSLRFVSSEN